MTTVYGKPWDHKASFGTIHGDNRFAYAQGEQCYNVMKQPVDSAGNVMPLPPAGKAKTEASGTTKSPSSLPVIDDDPDDEIPEDEVDIDLLAWAKGDDPALNALPWQTVKAQAATLLGDDMPSNKAEVRKAIIAMYAGAEPMIG